MKEPSKNSRLVNRPTPTKKRLILSIGSCVLLLAIIIAGLEKTHIINLYEKKRPTVFGGAQTTSTVPSAQPNFDNGGDRQPSTTTRYEGTVQDTGGQVENNQPESQWIKSKDGNITVFTPAESTFFKDGSSFAGSSSYPLVYFRLIDDVSGVIAQGSVAVSGGKFSGISRFSTKGTVGRFDVYHAAADGVESSNISIRVRFK